MGFFHICRHIRGEVAGRPVQYETELFREPRQLAAFPGPFFSFPLKARA